MIQPLPALVLRSGIVVDYDAVEYTFPVLASDLYYSLAGQNRYASHIRVTVLQHLALGVLLCRQMFPGDVLAVAAFAAHDLHECYFPDMVRPLKRRMPAYQPLEDGFERYVHAQIGLPIGAALREARERAKIIDNRVPAIEPFTWGHPHADHYAHHHGGPPTAEEIALGERVRTLSSQDCWRIVVAALTEAIGRDPFAGQAPAFDEEPLRVSFDIGGVLSKRPDVFRPFVAALVRGGADVYVITDMHDHAQSVRFVRENGYDVPPERILNADFATHGEACKQKVVEAHGIALHLDDFPGYCANTSCVNLLVWPDPTLPYYHDDFKTDGSEGSFGRRKKAT